MAPTTQRHQIGPEQGSLILRTARQGIAAQAGHDLTIEVARWSGELVLAEDPSMSTVAVTADTGSLRVLDGSGGIAPLSERDKREIARTARRLLDSDRQPEARFNSATTTLKDPEHAVLEGNLVLLGRERPFRLEITHLGGGRYRGTGTILQTEYGIKPYTAFFGALKLADPVTVEAEVDLS
jgi:polyisoprenoid-binding protein YceI